MSESLTIDADPGEVVTRQRRQRPERPEREAPAERVAIEGVDETLSPEAALADSARQLQDRDRAVAEERRRARDAEQRARAAEAEAANARVARVTDHQAIVGQAIEGAKAEQQSARLAKRAAREAGDIDAEMAADEALGTATFRLSQATAELEALKRQPVQQPQRQAGRSAAAQQWLDEHPRFNTDRKYRGAAAEAHSEAIRAGNPEGSQEYVDYIDNIMRQEFGENHGREDQPDRGQQPMNNPGRAASTTVPPSRGSGGQTQGGFRPVKTLLDQEPLHVQRQPGGGMRIRFASARQQADFEEGAATCRMSLADYVQDQIRIVEEREAGGTGDLVTGEGARFE